MTLSEDALDLHKKLKGKIGIRSKLSLTEENLSLVYTPGVAAVSSHIAKQKSSVNNYTSRGNNVAIVSDGTAVLGLGDIGPEAALPVMEGKAMLFKELANIDAFPICLDTKDTDEIVMIVKSLAPTFAGINLEDISAPRCFEIEQRLQDIGIPVMHDDQHGTAVVVMAALINALKVAKKDIEDTKIVIAGAGAAGIGIVKLLESSNAGDIILTDSKGIIFKGRDVGMNIYKDEISLRTNKNHKRGDIKDAIIDADVFIGVSGIPNLIGSNDIQTMNDKSIIFALSNPNPEILPTDAKSGGAFVIGTGRSDFPNQINNSLAFPGIFRGALDSQAHRITIEMKLAAAHAIAGTIKNPTQDCIVPKTTDKSVALAVAKAVSQAAVKKVIHTV